VKAINNVKLNALSITKGNWSNNKIIERTPLK
jgi:hypothetical protein